jgi:hypothetical protein
MDAVIWGLDVVRETSVASLGDHLTGGERRRGT